MIRRGFEYSIYVMLKMFIMLECLLKSLDQSCGKKKFVIAPEMLILIKKDFPVLYVGLKCVCL